MTEFFSAAGPPLGEKTQALKVSRRVSAPLLIPLYSQNPHAPRDRRETMLQAAIGREVRSCRRKHDMTIMELASSAGISIGMLSKIENGSISPSLNTLQALATALGLPMTSLFRRFEEKDEATFVKAGEGVNVQRRGTRAGHHYKLLGYSGASSSGLVVEPYLITLTEPSDEFPIFQHGGIEFLYVLEGEVVYGHGRNRYRMTQGDSLYFDADAPHGPYELTKLPIRFLSVISYRQGASNESLDKAAT
ncbi:helix-turn-helix domain-containing protein [Pseudaminobacter sp. NGMCC 1.201702]|uniref:helix-turn-helix domain-containing protein n=1 Tax=Pseudaminobacter sp. NGMCC 1.201702 TaxID=3391825 RepID=UPI0039EEA60B